MLIPYVVFNSVILVMLLVVFLKLNLRDDVVKITIDWNKLQGLSEIQPALLFSALEQHVLYLQVNFLLKVLT